MSGGLLRQSRGGRHTQLQAGVYQDFFMSYEGQAHYFPTGTHTRAVAFSPRSFARSTFTR